MQTQHAITALVAFLFGIFCAGRAQLTRRSAWEWFFLGLCPAPIAGAANHAGSPGNAEPAGLASTGGPS